MKNTHKINFACCICGQPGATLHEIWFGNGIRQLAIKYHLQAPVCQRHHDMAHGKIPSPFVVETMQEVISKRIGIRDYDFGQINHYVMTRDHARLANGEEERLKKILSFEVE